MAPLRSKATKWAMIPHCHVHSHPPEREWNHYHYLIDAGVSSLNFTPFKSMYKFSNFPIVEKLILLMISSIIYKEISQRISNDKERSRWKLTVTICSASGNRSTTENQPARINGVEILILQNRENMEIAIPHPACGIDHCRYNYLHK